MRTIGLTGNIGSGKSVVARVWEEMGAVVIDADRVAHQVLAPGSEALREVVAAFGAGIVGKDGRLDRTALAGIAFESSEALRRLNLLVHPRVIARVRERLEAERRAGTRVAVVEAALLYEAGVDGDYDVMVVVDAPRDLRFAWLRASRGLDPEEAARIERSQMDAGEKASRADHRIENRGDLEALRRAARCLLSRLTGTPEKGVDAGA